MLRAYAEKLTALEGELQATLKTRAEFESLRDRLKKAIEVADELSHSLKKQPPPLFPTSPNVTHSFDLIAMNAAEVGDFPQDFFLGSEPEPLSVRLIDKKKDPIH